MFKKNQKLSKISFIFQIRFIFIYINNSPKKIKETPNNLDKNTYIYTHTHIYKYIILEAYYFSKFLPHRSS